MMACASNGRPPPLPPALSLPLPLSLTRPGKYSENYSLECLLIPRVLDH
jgi:hypothetical protein